MNMSHIARVSFLYIRRQKKKRKIEKGGAALISTQGFIFCGSPRFVDAVFFFKGGGGRCRELALLYFLLFGGRARLFNSKTLKSGLVAPV